MNLPPLWEDVVACFCGHGIFDHDEYGPCAQCSCPAWNGCLVIGPAGGGTPAPSGSGATEPAEASICDREEYPNG